MYIQQKGFAEDTPWIHLDIAGQALIETTRPDMAKCASGVAVRSIVAWTRQF
jgi:leucyl aminopeptidase